MTGKPASPPLHNGSPWGRVISRCPQSCMALSHPPKQGTLSAPAQGTGTPYPPVQRIGCLFKVMHWDERHFSDPTRRWEICLNTPSSPKQEFQPTQQVWLIFHLIPPRRLLQSSSTHPLFAPCVFSGSWPGCSHIRRHGYWSACPLRSGVWQEKCLGQGRERWLPSYTCTARMQLGCTRCSSTHLAWAAKGPVTGQALLGKESKVVFVCVAQTSACTSASAVPYQHGCQHSLLFCSEACP